MYLPASFEFRVTGSSLCQPHGSCMQLSEVCALLFEQFYLNVQFQAIGNAIDDRVIFQY